jgi:FixJ family two-component response regulator
MIISQRVRYHRQSRWLEMVSASKAPHEIVRTVETYRAGLMQKLQLEDLVALVKFAIRNGMSSVD